MQLIIGLKKEKAGRQTFSWIQESSFILIQIYVKQIVTQCF